MNYACTESINRKILPPSNCKWITHSELRKRTSKKKYIEFNGESHTYNEWAEIIGIKADTLIYRLTNAHWSVEQALTTPTTQINTHINYRKGV